MSFQADNQQPTTGQMQWASYLLYSDTAKPPTKASVDTAWYDLYSAVDVTIEPDGLGMVSTGVGFILPRTIAGWTIGAEGLLAKGLLVEPTPVSPDGEGVVRVSILNLKDKPYSVKTGDMIARIVFKRIMNQRAMYPKRTFFKRRSLSEDTVN